MAPRGWMVRGLAWRLSQPGFDPSYGKLMSSHTDELWLNETDLSEGDYIYIYIYIYIYTHTHTHTHINLKERETHRQRQRIFTQNIYTQLIQCLCTNEILFSNSSDNSQKCNLNFFFLPFFSEIIQFNLKVLFILLLFLIWLSNLFQKYIALNNNKKSNG